MKTASLTKLILIALLFRLAPANAAQITVPAIADGEIDSAGVLGIAADTHATSIRTLRSGNSNIHHGAYVFDLSSIPDQANVTSVDLQFTLAGLISNTSDTARVEFHGYASDSVIEPADFNLPPSTDSTLLAAETFPAGSNGSPPIGSLVSIPLSTGVFQQIRMNSDPFMTLRSETVNFVTFHVHSLENEIGAMPPTLVVNAEIVPEPNPQTFLLPVLAVMLAIRRRR